MIIGFDLDDVLLDFQDTLRIYHNIHYGTNRKKDDDIMWNLWERWNCSQEEAWKRLQDFYVHDMHYNAPPIPGSIEGVQTLKKDHTLVLITAKPENLLREKTEKWIDKHMPNAFEQIVFTRPPYDKEKINKSEICKKLGVQIYIDDALHNAHDIAGTGIPVLLLDMPWNQSGELPVNVTRVFSWPEIVEKING